MKKLLLLLLPMALWANTLFVLFDVGETVALTPVIGELKKQGEEVTVLKFDPKTRDRYTPLSEEEVLGYAPDTLVVGDASLLQLQFVKAYKASAQTICYYDNPLEIDRIPYAPLIREFEKEVDLFLVPSKRAADSSIAKHLKILGNPDLDLFEQEVGKVPVVKGRITYFGGYDTDYEEAFLAFLDYVKDYKGEVVVIPHPKTDGALEERLTTGLDIQMRQDLSSIEAVGSSELIIVHRSSIGTKAAIAGKKVFAIESDGSIKEIQDTRDTLGIPSNALRSIASLLVRLHSHELQGRCSPP